MNKLTIAVLSAFAFAVAAPAGAADFSPAVQELIAGAKKEGKLELQWGAGMMGNNNVLKQMGDGMNAMFGTNIAVRFTPGPSEPEMLNKVMIAIASNQPSPTDIVINTTAGGPGGATDTVSSFIFREYHDRSNVGYGTMLAMFYLVLIIVFVTMLLELTGRLVRRMG